jgi:hypothetical protein
MSFAEFGGNNNTNKRRTQQQQQQQQQQQPSSPYNRGGGGPLGLDSISESLLQYQVCYNEKQRTKAKRMATQYCVLSDGRNDKNYRMFW